jgi:hypothetical protein
MQVSEALARLDVIHDHLSRSETYRGFRAGAVTLTGLLGLGAAALQPCFVAREDGPAFVRYWVVAAALCALPSAGTALFLRLFQEDGLARKRSDRVAGQFLPCIAAGAIVTVAFAGSNPTLTAFLPGLWAILFGLGNLAVRPFLPRRIVVVGVFYLATGAWLLGWPPEPTPSGWTVGGVFGIGHLASALVLFLDRERRDNV